MNMADSIDPNSLFCFKTMTYHSPRPTVPLPPHTTVSDYAFSLLHSSPPPPTAAALIDASTARRILFPDLLRRIETLAASLQHRFQLVRGDSALILSPNSLHIPILYYALFSLGVAVSPSNPIATRSEISRLVELSNPAVAFAATPGVARKIPPLRRGTVVLDSAEFESMMTSKTASHDTLDSRLRAVGSLSDTAAILYSSGTTGKVKGVALTHRNFIASVAGVLAAAPARKNPSVTLCTVPLFHVYGFGICVRAVAMGDTLVVVPRERFDLLAMARAIEMLRVSHAALAPPTIMAMLKDGDAMDGYDLSSLEVVGCGGAPLNKGAIHMLKKRLPNVQLAQSYGLTETTGRIFSSLGPKETGVVGATGRLASNCEAKIVEPETGICLPPGKPGELWVRGPLIMKGYVGDEEATSLVLDSEGWLRTGDLCYIDNAGFLFFVDRLKEIIKYKGFQVAPAELEHLLHSHPDILEAAVAGYPDEEAGHIPMAFVVRQSGSVVDELQIQDFIAKQVAPYKKIRRVMYLNSIPKNATGKVLRKELIKLALLNTGSKL